MSLHYLAKKKRDSSCLLCLYAHLKRSRSDETAKLSLLIDPIGILTGKKLDRRQWRRTTIGQLRARHQIVCIEIYSPQALTELNSSPLW